MIMKIYVGNLSYQTTEETIRKAFEGMGQITSITIIKDKYSGQSRGFAFVEMADQSEGQTAIKTLNGKELDGQPIKVNEAYDRPDRGRSGGPRGRSGYGGGRGGRY
jgi:RNA recognition motif-containing protein